MMTGQDFFSADRIKSVTTSDTVDIHSDERGCIIWCNGVAGNVHVLTKAGDDVTLAVDLKTLLCGGRLRVRRVLATGTTATGLFAISD
jgi:hypothetical protein